MILREGNGWDVFLNYFFALLFMFCILIGVTLNPLILFYHSKQKKSFINALFLLISSIDQIKIIYLPLFFIPKLLSSKEIDYSYCLSGVDFIPWSSYTNHFLKVLIGMEEKFLVVLCVARYLTIRRPLASTKKRNGDAGTRPRFIGKRCYAAAAVQPRRDFLPSCFHSTRRRTFD